MSKTKPKHYYCELFEQNFYFFIHWNPKDVIKYLNKDFYVGEDCDLDNSYGMTFDLGNPQGKSAICIFVNKKAKGVKLYQTIAHESVHAANFLFKNRGVKYEIGNEEILSYFVGKLVLECLK